ncbi:divergent polysaccharide deacetylase family protein [Shewanella phaeophyticola]|uniref:Divergent polysaccharide deacetylase family protein n=1 Tax=Shewanella phaeophyticola TaxID=2978345 RepID=A0ABT2P8X1_9GAMM|nr:divergent polysaccharide deacetylase family protein [Shewanella sp. KJ10-1]MCT8988325.1 divergent polysaccharide deacetylase family protein [Shewanella sp. KJ10-1]
MRILLIFFIYLCGLLPANAAKLAIIIDDIGYRLTDEAALTLPANITLSVLPHTPLGQKLANDGHEKGHEIMLHLPMQALNGKALGHGGLTNDMSETQIKQQLQAAFKSIPFAKGANNHMGSLLTQMDDPMLWVMQSLKQQQLFFVDSVTTKYTKASDTANQLGVPLLRRHVFLDNDVSQRGLEKQFNQIIERTKQQGKLVAIAHPYPETIQFLRANLTRLEANGIVLVQTSQLFDDINIATTSQANPTATLK